MPPMPGPRRGPRRPAPTPAPPAVDAPPPGPSHWSAANPADDVTIPIPPAPAVRPSTRTPKVGLGAPRTAQTGKPRVDWAAYDAQIYAEAPQWVLYRAWTRLPCDGRWWIRWWQLLLVTLLGPWCRLLWIGISMRSAIARATEHLADKGWRRLIHVFEIDPDAGDAGPPGARYFTTERAARLYEDARIAAECPMKNDQGNERAYNPGAQHLTKRILPRHVADWRRQAATIALRWLLVSAVCTWLLWPAADPAVAGFTATADRWLSGMVSGVAAGAVAMLVGRILLLAVAGAQPTTAQKARIAARR